MSTKLAISTVLRAINPAGKHSRNSLPKKEKEKKKKIL